MKELFYKVLLTVQVLSLFALFAANIAFKHEGYVMTVTLGHAELTPQEQAVAVMQKEAMRATKVATSKIPLRIMRLANVKY